MQVPRSVYDGLTAAVNDLSAKSRELFLARFNDGAGEFVDADGAVPPEKVAALREYAIALLDDVGGAASELAFAYGVDGYDAARAAAVGASLGASPAAPSVHLANEIAVRGMVDAVKKTGEIAAFADACAGRVDYIARKSCGDAVVACAARDPLKPRFARVPQGGETCRFCLMLASRGAVYHSEDTAGAVDHYHANCDCKAVPDFGDGIEGYDPDVLYSDYIDGSFGTFRNKGRERAISNPGGGREFGSVGEMSRYLRDAPDIDELYSRMDEVKAVLGKWFKDKRRRDGYLADIRRSASRRFVELTPTGGKGRTVYVKPRSELEEHEKAGIDHLTAHGFDVETIPKIGDAAVNLDIVMDGEKWEMKNVTNANSSVSNQIKRARIKWYKLDDGSKMRCVITCEGCSSDFSDVVDGVKGRKRPGEHVIVISESGEITKV